MPRHFPFIFFRARETKKMKTYPSKMYIEVKKKMDEQKKMNITVMNEKKTKEKKINHNQSH